MKKYRILYLAVISLVLSLFFAACKKDDDPILPNQIILSQSQVTVYDNESIDILVTVLPENAENKDYTITSSNTNVLTIDNKTVIISGAGSTTLTYTAAANPSVTATCEVTVNAYHALEQIVPQSDKITINFDNPAPNLTVGFLPTNATNQEFAVEIENQDIVRYTDGKFYGMRTGVTKAVLTGDNGITAEVELTVADFGFSVFDTDLYPIKANNKYYYCNYFGHTVLGPYKAASEFIEGYAAVKDENNKWFLIDGLGKAVGTQYEEEIYDELGRFWVVKANGKNKLLKPDGTVIFNDLEHLVSLGQNNEMLGIAADGKTGIYTRDFDLIAQTDGIYNGFNSIVHDRFMELTAYGNNSVWLDFVTGKGFVVESGDLGEPFWIGDNAYGCLAWKQNESTSYGAKFFSLINPEYFGNALMAAVSEDGIYIVKDDEMLLLNAKTHEIIETFDAPSPDYIHANFAAYADCGPGYLLLSDEFFSAERMLYTIEPEPKAVAVTEIFENSSYAYFGGQYVAYQTATDVYIIAYDGGGRFGEIMYHEQLPTGKVFYRYISADYLLLKDSADENDSPLSVFDINTKQIVNSAVYTYHSETNKAVISFRKADSSYDFIVTSEQGNSIYYKTQSLNGLNLYAWQDKIIMYIDDSLYFYDGTFIEEKINGRKYFTYEREGETYLGSRFAPGKEVGGFTDIYVYYEEHFTVDGKQHFLVVKDGNLAFVEGRLWHETDSYYVYEHDTEIFHLYAQTMKKVKVGEVSVQADVAFTHVGFEYIYEKKSNGKHFIYSLDRTQSLELVSNKAFTTTRTLGDSVGFFANDIMFGMFTDDNGAKRLGYYPIEAMLNTNLAQFVAAGGGVFVYNQDGGVPLLKTYDLPSGATDLEIVDLSALGYTLEGQKYVTIKSDFGLITLTSEQMINFSGITNYKNYVLIRFSNSKPNMVFDKDCNLIVESLKSMTSLTGSIGNSFGVSLDAYVFWDADTGLGTLYYPKHDIVINSIQSIKQNLSVEGQAILKINNESKFYMINFDGVSLLSERSGAKDCLYFLVESADGYIRYVWYEFDDGFMVKTNGKEYHAVEVYETYSSFSDRYYLLPDNRIAVIYGGANGKSFVFEADGTNAVYNARFSDTGYGGLITTVESEGENTITTIFTAEYKKIIRLAKKSSVSIEDVSGTVITMRSSYYEYMYYSMDGTLLGTYSDNAWKWWESIPVPFVLDDEKGLILYCGGTAPVELGGIKSIVGYGKTDNIGMFLDKADKLVIFDYSQGKTLYRAE